MAAKLCRVGFKNHVVLLSELSRLINLLAFYKLFSVWSVGAGAFFSSFFKLMY